MVEYEIIRHDQIKGLNVLANDIHMRSLHMHHDMELLLVVRGTGMINVRNKKCHVVPGDAILVNAFDTHEIICIQEGIVCLIVQVSNHFLRDYYPAIRNIIFLEESIRPFFSEEEYLRLCQDIFDLTELYVKAEPLFELSCVTRMSDILYLLIRNVPTETLNEAEYTKRKKLNRRFNRISSYIEANYQNQIRLADIAEQEEITITHLSHIFRDHFGISFQEYIKGKRLEHALRLIGDKTMTLSDIASASGFSELKYMTRAFREAFGLTPEQFRKQWIPLKSTARENTGEPERILTGSETLSLLKETKLSDIL